MVKVTRRFIVYAIFYMILYILAYLAGYYTMDFIIRLW